MVGLIVLLTLHIEELLTKGFEISFFLYTILSLPLHYQFKRIEEDLMNKMLHFQFDIVLLNDFQNHT